MELKNVMPYPQEAYLMWLYFHISSLQYYSFSTDLL